MKAKNCSTVRYSEVKLKSSTEHVRCNTMKTFGVQAGDHTLSRVVTREVGRKDKKERTGQNENKRNTFLRDREEEL